MENHPDSATDDLVTRREFTLKSALSILSGVVITVSGCDDDPPTVPRPTISQGPSRRTIQRRT